jgi:Flp pilus assembly protein TadG
MLATALDAGRGHRRGVATVEMAALLPLLVFMSCAAVDFARVFYYASTISGCARNGALYARRTAYDPASPFAGVQAAALADASGLQPTPTVTSTAGANADGSAFVRVQVRYDFQTFFRYPGLPNVIPIEKTVQMDVAPIAPE